jgi:phosphoribosylformylglycinamidine synthase subunit PurSL
MDAKKASDLVYLLGETYNELGSSQYFDMLGIAGGNVPKLRNPGKTIQSYRWLHRAIRSKLVASCHDLSDGGLGVAAAETAFSGNLGMTLDLRNVAGEVNGDEMTLFSESPGRILVTVSAAAKDAFEVMMGDTVKRVGEISAETRLKVTGLNGNPIIDTDVKALKESWQKTLRFSEVSK